MTLRNAHRFPQSLALVTVGLWFVVELGGLGSASAPASPSMSAGNDWIEGENYRTLRSSTAARVNAILANGSSPGIAELKALVDAGEVNITSSTTGNAGDHGELGLSDVDTISIYDGQSDASLEVTLAHEYQHVKNARDAGEIYDPTTRVNIKQQTGPEARANFCKHAEMHQNDITSLCEKIAAGATVGCAEYKRQRDRAEEMRDTCVRGGVEMDETTSCTGCNYVGT